RLAEVREPGRVQRRVEVAGVGQRERDRARAVVGRVDPQALGSAATVAAAVDIGQAGDLVGRGDDPLQALRRVRGRGSEAVAQGDGARIRGVGAAGLAVELAQLGADLRVARRAGRDATG